MRQMIKRFSLLGVLCCLLSFGSKAVVSLGEIELGTVYNIPNYASVVGSFTAPATGLLIQDGVPDVQIAGMEETRTFIGYGNYGQVYTYEVTEGTTYNIVAGFVMQGGSVCWTMGGSELSVSSIDPKEGSVISTTTNYIGDVFVKFSEPVFATGAVLSSATASHSAEITSQGEIELIINIKSALNALYADGLNPAGGEEVILTINGITSNSGTQYGTDGSLAIRFVSAPKTLALVSTNFADGYVLKSFYPEGLEGSVLEFTFDGDVANGPVFILSAGNPEAESAYYEEAVPTTVDGAKVSVNLAGKLRDLNAYVDATGFVGAKLANVRDTQGFFAQGNGEGNLGSYSYTFKYEYIEPVVISSEFTPASSASLKGVDQIEIWFNNADKIRFTGVQFACPAATAVVPLDQLEIVREGNDLTITVDVPAEVKDQENVTVTLAGLVSLDGYDHSREIMAVYDAFVATLVSPIQDGKSYASTGDDDFVFTFNDTFPYMRYDFYNGDEWVYGTQINDAGDGTWTAYNGNYTLYKGVDNRMLVRCYNEESEYWGGAADVASYEFHFGGLTAPFTYSDVKFVSIDPEPNTAIEFTDDFCFTITFDGLVSIGDNSCVNLGMGFSSPFAQLVPVDPEELTGLSSQWKLYPNVAAITGTGIDISVYAYDETGKLVEGNMGGGEYDFLQFSWMLESADNLRPLTVSPEDGSTVAELNFFELSCPGQAIGVNYNYMGDMPQITNKLGEVVYTFTDLDIQIADPLENEITVAYLTVSEPLTDGVYVLYVPERFFMLGSQFETYYNEALYAGYTVGDGGGQPGEAVELTLDPAPGKVTEISVINITAPEIEWANSMSEECITLTSADGEVLFSADGWGMMNSSFDWDTWTFTGFKIDLSADPITATGTYVVDIPKGFFEFMDMSRSAALNAIYTIGDSSGVKSLLVEKADVYNVYDLSGRKVLTTHDASALGTLNRGIYIINGRKVMVK